MDRQDTKFILSQEKLNEFLLSISPDYQVLEVDQNRMMTYRTRYFDTSDMQFYLEHHNGRVNRHKVRVREYVESNLCFLEVKRKDNRGKTHKERVQITDWVKELTPSQRAYVQGIWGHNDHLEPKLSGSFNRITLANKVHDERITVDLNLEYSNANFNANLCVVELKQPGLNTRTSAYKSLRALKILPYSFSKYCVGMALTYEDLKKNNFKSKIKHLERI